MADTAPKASAYELVGRFFYHFRRVELQLNDAITKLFDLGPAKAQIIISNIDFVRKVYIVHSAVALQTKSGKPVSVDVKETFGSVKGINDRRVVVAHTPIIILALALTGG